jgi:hypothetical protein
MRIASSDQGGVVVDVAQRYEDGGVGSDETSAIGKNVCDKYGEIVCARSA